MTARTRASIPSLAVACGVAVASVYYAHPLLALIAKDMRMPAAAAGNVVAAGQIGYAVGLLLIAPLGDLFDRRNLIVGHLAMLCGALLAVSVAPSENALLAAMAVVGLAAVVTQTMVAHASLLVPPDSRGQTVGTLTSGVVIGIVAARVLGGMLAEAGGWRAVFATAAAASGAMAVLLWKVLEREQAPRAHVPYLRLVSSAIRLFALNPGLRNRGFIGLFVFASITMMSTPLALALSAPPHRLSAGQIGLFGICGIAGAMGARYAGRRADAGAAQASTLVGLGLMLAASAMAGLLPMSLFAFFLGALAMDFGVQAVHVSNQGVIYAAHQEARSRLAAGYMVFYSVGCAFAAALSTRIHDAAGWTGVCVATGASALAALACWCVGRKRWGRPVPEHSRS